MELNDSGGHHGRAVEQIGRSQGDGSAERVFLGAHDGRLHQPGGTGSDPNADLPGVAEGTAGEDGTFRGGNGAVEGRHSDGPQTSPPPPEQIEANNKAVLAKTGTSEADTALPPETVDRFKGDKQTLFICLQLALDTTKKWNLKHHLSDRLNAMKGPFAHHRQRYASRSARDMAIAHPIIGWIWGGAHWYSSSIRTFR